MMKASHFEVGGLKMEQNNSASRPSFSQKSSFTSPTLQTHTAMRASYVVYEILAEERLNFLDTRQLHI
jgi:hypothetical protein